MGYSNDYKRTIKGRAVSLMGNARKRCKEKEIELHLTQEWVEEHLLRGTCEITGLHFCFEPPDQKATRRWDAPSLDRIDKDEPYTENNTRVILWAVNCALSEYGTKIMLPILKAMVKGIESANKKTITPLPTGHYPKSKEHTKHGTVLTAGTREDSYDLDHYLRTVSGEDSDYRTQTRGGDSVAHRNKKVEPLEGFTRLEDNGESDAEIVRLDFGRRHLPDKS
jgi:hypothetical protein